MKNIQLNAMYNIINLTIGKIRKIKNERQMITIHKFVVIPQMIKKLTQKSFQKNYFCMILAGLVNKLLIHYITSSMNRIDFLF